jgi:hypothetical protein
VIDVCPILRAGDLPSVVDESVFLKEVSVALDSIRAQSVPRGTSVVEAARWCLGQVSGALLADGRRQGAGTASHPPLTGVFAPVDLEAVQADPACSVGFFAGVLREWGIGGVPADAEHGIPDAVRRLDLTTGCVHRLRGRVPVPGDPASTALDWSMGYVPFTLLSGEVGLLFGFAAGLPRGGRRGSPAGPRA